MKKSDANADCALLLFARPPVAGKTKTRLIPAYGAQGALMIYQQLLARAFAVAQSFGGPVQLWLAAPDTALAQLAQARGWACYVQQGEDLGQRMSHALHCALAQHKKALLIGSDCPVMNDEYLQHAVLALASHPVAFGPSDDGGYVLLGSADQALWTPSRFQAVRFGTQHALQDSLVCFERSQTTQLTALWDVDTARDAQKAAALGLLELPASVAKP